MRRRELIAGALGGGLLVGGGAVALGGVPSFGDDGESEPTEPIEVRTLEARGSEAGTMTIPDDDRLTVVTFFATTCSSCAEKMPHLAEAAATLEGEPIQFVSVTTEPVGNTVPEAEVVEWFESRGGDWLLAHDEGSRLTVAYDGVPYPKTAVVDSNGRTLWEHVGVASTDKLLEGFESALADAEL